jgi:hydrogenase expression/formation protein HypC
VSAPEVPVCVDPYHCITCGDDGVPMVVVELSADGLARCRTEAGEVRLVETALIGELRSGDVVLVHADVAIALAGELST